MRNLALCSALWIGCTPEFVLLSSDCPVEAASVYYTDNDGDGFGEALSAFAACEAPEGTVTRGDDCDDDDADVHPEAAELCNGVDDNCDQRVDDLGTIEGFLDQDGDGYGSIPASVENCDPPEGIATQPGDCDDSTAAVNPGAAERCDAIDWDCDGEASTSWTGDVLCEVLIYEGHTDATHRLGPSDLASFTDTLLMEGATDVAVADMWPDDLSGYRMLYLSHANQSFTDLDIERLESYRSQGGVLLLVAENGEWGSGMIPVYNHLLEGLELQMRLLPEALDPGCKGWVANVEALHPLTKGVDETSYAFSSGLALGDHTTGLIRGASDQWLVAIEDGVLAFSDSTLLMDHCEGALLPGNLQFMRNLFHLGAGPN